MSGPPPALPSIPTAAVASPAAANPPANQASVANPASLPPALAQLTVGTQVEAQVLSSVGQTLQVSTPQGQMTLQTPMPVPPGAVLTLLMTAQGSQPQFRIAALDGQPVNASGQVQTPQQPLPNLPTPAAAAPPELSSQPPANAGIRALVLPSPLPPSPDQPQLPPGSNVTVRLLSVEVPEPTPAPAEAGAQPQQTASAPPAATPQRAAQAYGAAPQPIVQEQAPPPSTPPASVTQEPAPAELQTPQSQTQPQEPPAPAAAASSSPAPSAQTPQPPVMQAPAPPPAQTTAPAPQATPVPLPQQPPSPPVVTEQPAPLPTPATAPALPPQPQPQPQPQLQPGQVLNGQVPDSSRPGNPQVATPAGLLSLQANLDLPAGTKVALQIVSPPEPPEPEPLADPAPPTPLRKGMEALKAALPQLADQLEKQLPSLGHPRLAFQLLALTTAVRHGKAAELLQAQDGATASALAQLTGKPDILHGLDQGLSSLRQTVTVQGSGVDQWQAYVLPFLVEGREQSLRLVVRDKPEGESGPEAQRRAEEGTRFLIDLDMTHLGSVQLDGLVKGRAKRFDLIIRTHIPIADSMRLGIAEVFTRTLDGFGMTGRASFQTVPAFVEAMPVSRSNPLPTA